jgi:hypothetical protein
MSKSSIQLSLLIGFLIAGSVVQMHPVQAIGLTVTSISTLTTLGTSSSVTGVAGGDGPGGSPFPSASTYNINYAGQKTAITGFSTGTGTGIINQASQATFSVVRSLGTDDRQNVWYQGTISGNNLSLLSDGPNSLTQALSGNNILVGSDNLFTNTGNGQNNQSTIERLDFVTGPLAANAAQGFTIFERGTTNAHDGFKIAAILSVDSFGKPTSYGLLQSLSTGSWGTTALVTGGPQYFVTNNNATGGTGAPTNPSANIGGQNLGGIFIRTDELAALGSTIYGYSLFGADVLSTCTSANLVSIDSTCFPSTTADSSGGIDLVGANLGVVNFQANAVPEPGQEPALPLIGGCLSAAVILRRRASFPQKKA